MGDTVAEAAEKISVSERTAYRWLQEKRVKQAIREGRQLGIRLALSANADVATFAMRTLKEIIVDESVAAGTRVRASLGVLQLASQADSDDVREDVEEIKEELRKFHDEERTF